MLVFTNIDVFLVLVCTPTLKDYPSFRRLHFLQKIPAQYIMAFPSLKTKLFTECFCACFYRNVLALRCFLPSPKTSCLLGTFCIIRRHCLCRYQRMTRAAVKHVLPSGCELGPVRCVLCAVRHSLPIPTRCTETCDLCLCVTWQLVSAFGR
jgi:hypothetical protein